MTTTEKNAINGRDQLISYVLEDIKAIWDREGFGTEEAESEPLYARLNAAIRLLQEGV